MDLSASLCIPFVASLLLPIIVSLHVTWDSSSHWNSSSHSYTTNNLRPSNLYQCPSISRIPYDIFYWEPWPNCIPTLHDGRLNIICDEILSHKGIISVILQRWLHKDDMEYVHLNCDATSSKTCFCTELPDSWYEDLLCHKDIFTARECHRAVLSEEFLPLSNLRHIWINKLDLSGQAKNIFSDSVNLTSLHLLDTKLTVEQLPVWCELSSLQSLKLKGIILRNVSDVLANCENETNQLNFLNNLQELALESANLSDLPVQGICPDCINLNYLSLSGNTISFLQNYLFSGLTSLLELDLSSNNLTILDISNFQLLIELGRLDVSCNHILHISYSFTLLKNIYHVSMHNNQLPAVDSSTFQNTTSLNFVDISYNYIESIAEDTFYGTSVQDVNLSHNRIQQVPDLIMYFKNQFAHFIQCPAKFPHKCGTYAFNSLNLSHNAIHTLDLSTFTNLVLGQLPTSSSKQIIGLELDLSHNHLQTLDLAALGCGSLSYLILSNNNITAIIMTKPAKVSLSTLSLVNNNIKYIHPEMFNYITLSWLLDLSGNHILIHQNTTISAWNASDVIIPLHQKEIPQTDHGIDKGHFFSIRMEHSMITQEIFQKDIFAYYDIIGTLSLSNNLISSLEDLFSSSLCTNVDSLDLSHNPIHLLPSTISAQKDCSIRRLKLISCNLTSVPLDIFIYLPEMKVIYLDHNEITELHETSFQRTDMEFNLQGNPIRCSCHLTWLKHKSQSLYKDILFTDCFDVVHHKMLPFSDVPIDHFWCPVNDSMICDPRCECLAPSLEGDVHPVYVFCNNRSMKTTPKPLSVGTKLVHLENSDIHVLDFEQIYQVRHTKEIYLQNSNIRYVLSHAFDEFQHLRKLYLDNNHISTLDLSIFTPLTVLKVLSLSHNDIKHITVHPVALNSPMRYLYTLDLNGNKITELSENMRKYLESQWHLYNLSLADNPWQCDDCLKRGLFKNWLFFGMGGRQRIRDYDDILCINATHEMANCWEEIKKAKERWARNLNYSWIPGIILLLTAAAMVLLWKYKQKVRVWATSMWPSLRSLRPEIELPYDAFISYDKHNRPLRTWVVSTLLPRLGEPDQGPGYRLFLMERDATVIADQSDIIHTAIRHSKRSIIMISQTYESDGDTYTAFREAEYFSLMNDKHRVMVVLFDVSVQQAQAMDELICVYIDRQQYLIVTNHSFWRQLFYFMPHQPRRAEERQRHYDNIDREETQFTILNRMVHTAPANQNETCL